VSGPHGRGHRPDPPDVAARRKGFHLLRAKRSLVSAELPLSVDLTQFVTGPGGPGIFDQGSTGSCEGHAHAGAITTRFAALAMPIPTVSPIGIYTLARCIGRQPNADGSLPALTDDGTEPSLAIAAVQEWGVTSAATWGNFPADPSTINENPEFSELEEASDFRLLGAYFLQSAGDQKVIDIMTALAAGYPVAMALPASGAEFNDYTGGILGALDGPVDHANYLVGYELSSPGNYGSVVVKCVNSWGKWGEGGMYRGNRAFVDQLEDCCVIDVAPATQGSAER
jgi:hypothetical protein